MVEVGFFFFFFLWNWIRERALHFSQIVPIGLKQGLVACGPHSCRHATRTACAPREWKP